MRALLRLRDDPGVGPELRADLERAVAVDEPYDVASGEAKLLAALAGAMAAGTSESAAADVQAGADSVAAKGAEGLWSGAGAKLAVAAVMAGAIAASLFVLDREPAPRPAQPRPAAAPAAIEPPAPATAPPAPAAAAVAPVPAPAAAPAAERAAAAPARVPADGELRRETAQLGIIKQLLEHDPARAYALAQSGHRKFPRGMLREEREALAVIALWNTGEENAARRRAEAFLARYPNSAVRGQVEQRLARAREGDANAP